MVEFVCTIPEKRDVIKIEEVFSKFYLSLLFHKTACYYVLISYHNKTEVVIWCKYINIHVHVCSSCVIVLLNFVSNWCQTHAVKQKMIKNNDLSEVWGILKLFERSQINNYKEIDFEDLKISDAQNEMQNYCWMNLSLRAIKLRTDKIKQYTEDGMISNIKTMSGNLCKW